MKIPDQKAEIVEQEIAVTLLLKDGYERRVKLDATDPSLLSLLEVVAKRNVEKAEATVFNLEMENREGSLFFAASDLIALSTNPPISIDLTIDNPDIQFSHVVKDNYLSKGLLASLLKFVEGHAEEFETFARAKRGGRKSRRSLILNELGDFKDMFCERVRSDLPAVLEKLQIPDFPISGIDCQIAAYHNDHYFKRHCDSGYVTPRIVTFVYYFHNEPRSFEGGSLRLYNGKLENGVYTCGKTAVDLDPTNNAMLFFPSACYHEVLPIKCSSGEFRDGRFAVAGCVRMPE
jgi:SM-20-related protein